MANSTEMDSDTCDQVESRSKRIFPRKVKLSGAVPRTIPIGVECPNQPTVCLYRIAGHAASDSVHRHQSIACPSISFAAAAFNRSMAFAQPRGTPSLRRVFICQVYECIRIPVCRRVRSGAIGGTVPSTANSFLLVTTWLYLMFLVSGVRLPRTICGFVRLTLIARRSLFADTVIGWTRCSAITGEVFVGVVCRFAIATAEFVGFARVCRRSQSAE